MEELLFTLFVIVAIAYLLVRRFGRLVYLSSKIPGPSMWEILTVHAKRLLSDNLLTHLWKICESHDFKPWAMWLYNHFTVVVSDEDTIREVFKSKNLFNKLTWLYPVGAEYLGNGLVTLNGNDYRRHRKIISPAFRKAVLESQLSSVNAEATTLVEEIRNVAESSSVVDVQPLLKYRVLVLAFSCFTSGTYVYSNIHSLVNAIYAGFRLIRLRTLNPFYYWFLKIFRKSLRQTEAMVEGLLKEMREEFLNQKVLEMTGLCKVDNPSCLKEIFIHSYMNGEQGMSEEECFQETKTLLISGSESTSVGMSVVLLMLALHQDVQQRVFEEMESIFGHNHRSVEMEDIDQMAYLDMVIKETIRMLPPVPLIGRHVAEETELNGVVLPKGTSVLLNIFALHRNPNAFKDPLKFDPERFSPERCEKHDPYAYIPFSSGFRTCPGQLQAMIILKTFLCHIVRNFKVLPGGGIKCMDDIHVKMDFVLRLPEYSLRCVSREIE